MSKRRLKFQRRTCKQPGRVGSHSEITVQEKPARNLGWGWQGADRLAGREFRNAHQTGSKPAQQLWPGPTHPLGCPVHPPHHDLGEDVPSVLAFSLQPQRAQRLLQPRRRAPSRGPFRGSWGGARARGDALRLWVKGGCWTLKGRFGVSAWSAGWEGDPGSHSSPASSRLASRSKPRAQLFLLERGALSKAGRMRAE